MALLEPYELRYVARYLFANARARGKVPPAQGQDCADCGGPAVEYDHRSYMEPLNVEPVCSQCNSNRGQGWPPTDHEPVEVPWYSPKGIAI